MNKIKICTSEKHIAYLIRKSIAQAGSVKGLSEAIKMNRCSVISWIDGVKYPSPASIAKLEVYLSNSKEKQ